MFFCQAQDGIRDATVTGVQTCALPILDLINATLFGNGCTGGTGNANGNRLGGNLRNSSGLVRLRNTIIANSSSGTNAVGTITDGDRKSVGEGKSGARCCWSQCKQEECQ